jgi:hypothetical protein
MNLRLPFDKKCEHLQTNALKGSPGALGPWVLRELFPWPLERVVNQDLPILKQHLHHILNARHWLVPSRLAASTSWCLRHLKNVHGIL